MGEVNDEDEIAKNKSDNPALDRAKTNELLTEAIHSYLLLIENRNEVQQESTVSFKLIYKLKANKD